MAIECELDKNLVKRMGDVFQLEFFTSSNLMQAFPSGKCLLSDFSLKIS